MNQPQAEVIAERIVERLFLGETRDDVAWSICGDQGATYKTWSPSEVKAEIVSVLNSSSPTTPGEE